MNVLYYFWNENSAADIEEAFSNLGYSVVKISYPLQSYDFDPAFESQLEQLLCQYSFDCIYTFNYFPILSNIAEKFNLPYVSWIYDCPNLTIYSRTITNSCNYLFVFDRNLFHLVRSMGAKHIFHMPLAVNTNRLNRQLQLGGNLSAKEYSYDLSFVGSLYENNMYDQIQYLPQKLRGYYDGIMRAQQEVWGYHFLEEVIGDDILEETLACVRLEENPNYTFSSRQILVHMLDQKITSCERIHLLNQIAKFHMPDLFTGSASDKITGARTHGYISYTEEMPSVFQRSKINLNITLRSITSGIPLRCLDIMGACGFLLSNYQPELAEYFIAGKDYVYFESEEDLLNKIDYYLAHETERQEIAQNGWEKVQSDFSYEHQVKAIFSKLQV